MAGLMQGTITIKKELRPCRVNRKKALFHKWEEVSEIIEPSALIGGHKGGELKYTVGIVEMENGKLGRFLPSQIKFVDNEVNNYWCENAVEMFEKALKEPHGTE